MSPARVAPAHNPLREPRDKRLPRIAGPCGLVLFGVTGDLARKKLMPAIYDLANRGLLPPGFSLVGFARRDWADQDFGKVVYEAVKQHARTPFREDVWRNLSEGFRFVPGVFDDPAAFDLLAETVHALEKERGTGGNLAFYLSIPPAFFSTVCEQLERCGLTRTENNYSWRRVVIEKPFGHDLESARELNSIVEGVFPPDSVFRIDHYLGKETVQNLLAFRFANLMFEPVWNRNYIDHVQITAAEDIGIGTRAGYYDTSGALRDLVQNHMLQLLTLLCMEPPSSFDADKVRDEKVKVLDAIRPPTPEDVAEMTVRAQYTAGSPGGEDVPGYLDEDGVPDDSQTETYAALRLEVHNWRWEGVPFFLRTGKRLSRKTTEIAVQLKPVPHLAFASAGSVGVQPNLLILAVQPNEGVSLSLGAKIPGSRMRIRPVNMEFLYGSSFMSQSPEAYERLIQDAMRGEATLFTRDDEVIAQWSIIDPILKAWKENQPAKSEYAAGSPGPPEADALIAPRKWRGL